MVKVMTDLTFSLSDVTLEARSWGDPSSPLALLLHGFPDTADTFRFLGPHLAERGYYAVAPFMRGYAPSSVSLTNNYQLAALANDANRIHELLGANESAVLIGHDWGAAATYPALSAEPSRWRRGITMAVPPIAVTGNAFMTFSQLQSSWYMFFFQNALADVVVPLNDYDFINQLWAQWSPGYEANEDLARVKASLLAPENLAAALGYYRAMFGRSELIDPSLRHVQDAMLGVPPMPVLYLHGENDGCFKVSSLSDPTDYLSEGSIFDVVPATGHFLHLEDPERVHEAIDRFLS